MRLQTDAFNSQGVVIGNHNSSVYRASAFITTSYIVSVYSQAPIYGSHFKYDDQEIIYFAGDTFFGRLLKPPLSKPPVTEAIVREIKKFTGGAPLVLNLETVLLDDPPEKLPDHALVSHAELAIPFFKNINVKAVSLANNHTFDLGDGGYSETKSILEQAGIIPLTNERSVDLGPIRVVGLNFVGLKHPSKHHLLADPSKLCHTGAQPPFIAFVHWGREFVSSAGLDEYEAADAMHSCGVSAIIGSHSHLASSRIESRQGGEYQMVFSLGNFLFDQRTPRSSGALIEMRVFKFGTYATRLIAIPNFFERGVQLMHRMRSPDVVVPCSPGDLNGRQTDVNCR